jgi:hypothetical protein
LKIEWSQITRFGKGLKKLYGMEGFCEGGGGWAVRKCVLRRRGARDDFVDVFG